METGKSWGGSPNQEETERLQIPKSKDWKFDVNEEATGKCQIEKKLFRCIMIRKGNWTSRAQ